MGDRERCILGGGIEDRGDVDNRREGSKNGRNSA
jgi:hypothetical protein